jgi:hypothetical protein
MDSNLKQDVEDIDIADAGISTTIRNIASEGEPPSSTFRTEQVPQSPAGIIRAYLLKSSAVFRELQDIRQQVRRPPRNLLNQRID